jgi:hypothetical protein
VRLSGRNVPPKIIDFRYRRCHYKTLHFAAGILNPSLPIKPAGENHHPPETIALEMRSPTLSKGNLEFIYPGEVVYPPLTVEDSVLTQKYENYIWMPPYSGTESDSAFPPVVRELINEFSTRTGHPHGPEETINFQRWGMSILITKNLAKKEEHLGTVNLAMLLVGEKLITTDIFNQYPRYAAKLIFDELPIMNEENFATIQHRNFGLYLASLKTSNWI